MPIPVIDLFAGPGGLGEGFSSLESRGEPVFRIGISIEKDPVAHRTLTLRAVYRLLQQTRAQGQYYGYLTGELPQERFGSSPQVARAFREAREEALCLELGKIDPRFVDERIRKALGGERDWVLIGGPPCQAYSLAGRARRTHDVNFAGDEKHFLYREYLRIIQVHRPAVFVMENVKGLLSSRHSGDPMFVRIIEDLARPTRGLTYEIRSFTKVDQGLGLSPEDYVIESERFGVPQNRHRVILFGVRSDLSSQPHALLAERSQRTTVRQAISDLPRVRSRLSRSADTPENWHSTIATASKYVVGWGAGDESEMVARMGRSAIASERISSTGARFLARVNAAGPPDEALRAWVSDARLGGVSLHEARSHMPSDLARYMFAACFAREYGYSPRLKLFPKKLLPKHLSAAGARTKIVPFMDRFRVQCADEPSSTVVSHIAKDGNYYIHYDPAQCRSLTVREAARLQTFPDNYLFEGNRTQQYMQVGNAVPPLLAHQIARIVSELLGAANLGANWIAASRSRKVT